MKIVDKPYFPPRLTKDTPIEVNFFNLFDEEKTDMYLRIGNPTKTVTLLIVGEDKAECENIADNMAIAIHGAVQKSRKERQDEQEKKNKARRKMK